LASVVGSVVSRIWDFRGTSSYQTRVEAARLQTSRTAGNKSSGQVGKRTATACGNLCFHLWKLITLPISNHLEPTDWWTRSYNAGHEAQGSAETMTCGLFTLRIAQIYAQATSIHTDGAKANLLLGHTKGSRSSRTSTNINRSSQGIPRTNQQVSHQSHPRIPKQAKPFAFSPEMPRFQRYFMFDMGVIFWYFSLISLIGQ